MNFLSRQYNALVGEAQSQQQTPRDTIQRLANRIDTSTLPQDRKAAVLGLKGLSKEYKEIVGEEALDNLLLTLSDDIEDSSMVKVVLETLNNLCESSSKDQPNEIAAIHARRIIESENHIGVLLELVGNSDFYVRYNALQQLEILLVHGGELLLSKILVSPTGVGRLVDLLSDSREIVRNEGIQLLISMTQKNSEIQKIVAFENAFDKIFAIIQEEGGVGGNIIIQDCLQLLHNLLGYNVSNQNFFRETSCIQKLTPLLQYDPGEKELAGYVEEESTWKDQEIRNMITILDIVRMLVRPGNINTENNQKVMQQCGVISPLLQHALSVEVPNAIRAQALCTVGDIIRGNSDNQQLFQRILITGTADDDEDGGVENTKMVPEPAVLVIARIAVGTCPHEVSADTYDIVRASANYLVRSYLEDNFDAKLAIAATFNPPPQSEDGSQESHQSIGSLLVSVMTMPLTTDRQEVMRVWHAANLFSLLLHNNDVIKQLALKVVVTGDDQNSVISLLQALANQATFFSQHRGRDSKTTISPESVLLVALLSALSVWMYNSPPSVSQFLQSKSNCLFIVELISSQPSAANNENSHIFVERGIGCFLLGLLYELNGNDGSISSEELHLLFHKRIGIDQMLFCLSKLNDSHELHSASSMFNPVVAMDIGIHIDSCFADIFRSHYGYLRTVLKQKPNALDLQKSMARQLHVPGNTASLVPSRGPSPAMDSTISPEHFSNSVPKSDYDKLMADLESTKSQLNDALSQLKQQKEQQQQQPSPVSLRDTDPAADKILTTKLDSANNSILELQSTIASNNALIKELNIEITQLKSDNSEMSSKISTLTADLNLLSVKKEEPAADSETTIDRINELEKEQEDLLVLLADQDATLKLYRSKLRSYGEDIPPSDNDDDDDDFDDEE
ncbi:General vesicular transport factor [Zancudomyces culisetae]|uniref:General vesicular transport factor n=1 Tax=Zancudomyces culisetae TaxID=1213189 RepID=A0A1R1PLI6_ZANCU|nr:General vesicular transport factor [Zancudomyces culisetae]|eukprot:OMH81838.1 General vesicular transport factor [Zancudomyces culisetae]